MCAAPQSTEEAQGRGVQRLQVQQKAAGSFLDAGESAVTRADGELPQRQSLVGAGSWSSPSASRLLPKASGLNEKSTYRTGKGSVVFADFQSTDGESETLSKKS